MRRVLITLLTSAALAAATLPGSLAAPPTSLPATTSAPATASTQSHVLPTSPPSTPGSRIVHQFDFEERQLGNFENTPMYWSKVVGRGFPAYSSGQFDGTIHRSGSTSFRLDIDGGSAAYQYVPAVETVASTNDPTRQPVITVQPDADYYLIGFVRTSQLRHAKAQISAWFADADGHILPSTERRTAAFASPQLVIPATDANPNPPPDSVDDQWQVLHMFIPGPRSDASNPAAALAKSLVVQVGLLQPQQLAQEADATGRDPSGLGKFSLYQQDIKGSAWFDDLTIFQLPRVSIAVPANVPGNLFNAGSPVTLDLTVADLVQATGVHGAPQPAVLLTVTLQLADDAGTVWANERWDVHPPQEAPATREPWAKEYQRAALPAGLYTATMDIHDPFAGTLIARRTVRFAVVTPLGLAAQPAAEFGLSATAWPMEAWGELPALVKQSGAGLLQLPAWRRDMSEEALRGRDPIFDSVLNAMQRSDVRVMAMMKELPDPVAAALPAAAENLAQGRNSLLTLNGTDPTLWRPGLSFVLARYATLIDTWEIGSPGEPFSGTLRNGGGGDYSTLYAKLSGEMSSLLNSPHLVIPWNALFDFDKTQFPRASLDLLLPPAMKPKELPNYLKSFRQSMESGGQLFAHIQPLDETHYRYADWLADFAQRIVYARSAQPSAVLIDLPFEREGSLTAPVHTEPASTFLAFRTLARALAGTTFRREIPVAPGIHAFLFRQSADNAGTVVAWNESAATSPMDVTLPVGDRARLLRLTGQTDRLVASNGRATVSLTPLPQIIDRVDASLLELRASFALGTSTLPAGTGLVRTTVSLTNPYGDSMTGTLRLELPKGWVAEPSTFALAMGPNAVFTAPLTLRYPYNEGVGPREIRGALRVDSPMLPPPGSPGPLDLSCPIEIRSDTVETDGFARILPNGDLMVQQTVTNISVSPLNAEAYALVPGYARQQRFVVNLGPGESTIKRFIFPMNANAETTSQTTPEQIVQMLSGKSATVGLRQNDGKTLITRALPME